jgi:hypothetical protein
MTWNTVVRLAGLEEIRLATDGANDVYGPKREHTIVLRTLTKYPLPVPQDLN